MTDTRRPPACHFDPTAGVRVTRDHGDDCTTPETHQGCVPCTAHHCVLCRTRHATNDHPVTCPTCIGRVRTDLADIRQLHRHLRLEAIHGGGNGHPLAGAPIPGGTAMVMVARAGADLDDLIWSPWLDDDHQAKDPVPTLLPLAGWAVQWRRHHGHVEPATPTVAGIVGYLVGHLDRMAQTVDGPDWAGFATDIGVLRRTLEQVLHDEREPERGVSCFECGDQLVRKFGEPRACWHLTPGRKRLAELEAAAAAGREYLTQVIGSYPELRGDEYPMGSTHVERRHARPPTSAQVSAASKPCERCTNQGGIADPSVGQSWECIGCRKHYTPGEYSNAVRADLLRGGPDGDGWTHIGMAAEAATTQTGVGIPASTVRKWMDRNKVAAVCRWTPGAQWGLRLVFWPDVADQAAKAVVRHHEILAERARRAAEVDQLRKAVDAGQDAKKAGKRLGIHPARVRAIMEAWDSEVRASA